MTQWQHKEKQRWPEEQEQPERQGQKLGEQCQPGWKRREEGRKAAQKEKWHQGWGHQ
jgi:hypothetical protein